MSWKHLTNTSTLPPPCGFSSHSNTLQLLHSLHSLSSTAAVVLGSYSRPLHMSSYFQLPLIAAMNCDSDTTTIANGRPASLTKVTSSSGKDNDSTSTIQPGMFPNDDSSDTATIFDVFKEVALDLTFSFSAQNSPSSFIEELPRSESCSPSPSPPPSPSLPSVDIAPSINTISRTMSFASQMTPLSFNKKKKLKSSKLSPQQSSSILRGSWPMMKYVGKGTPIDKGRRNEWIGVSAENVDENGLLFSSDVRATSLDSRSPRPSSSSDWDFLNTGLPSGSPHSAKRSISAHEAVEEKQEKDRVPPLQRIEINLLEGETSDDWASVMETVLGSGDGNQQGIAPLQVLEEEETTVQVEDDTVVPNVVQDTGLPQEELDKIQSELQFDINLDQALDIGFNPVGEGGNLFTLAGITDSNNSNLTIRRTNSASSHSQYSTPSEGPSSDNRPIASGLNSTQAQERTPVSGVFSEVRSTSSIRALPVGLSKKEEAMYGPWWKRALIRLKRVPTLLRNHRNSC